MSAKYNATAFRIWALLVAVTLVSWLLTEETAAAQVGTTAVIAIAAFKVNMVIAYFMEVAWQPRPWRFVLSAWIVAVLVIVLGGYWLT